MEKQDKEQIKTTNQRIKAENIFLFKIGKKETLNAKKNERT
jgi:hypothetical protein